jgi:hypothetical protein
MIVSMPAIPLHKLTVRRAHPSSGQVKEISVLLRWGHTREAAMAAFATSW